MDQVQVVEETFEDVLDRIKTANKIQEYHFTEQPS